MNDLANLKSNIDKLDIGKFETALIDLTKLSDVVWSCESCEVVKLWKKLYMMNLLEKF